MVARSRAAGERAAAHGERQELDSGWPRFSAAKEGLLADLAQDLAIDLGENRPGTLAAAVEAIAKAGINIEGYAEVEGILHVVTRDASRARRAVETAGLPVREERTVLLYAVPDRPGALASLLRRVADAGVNVSFSYVAASNRVVLAANDLAKARESVSE